MESEPQTYVIEDDASDDGGSVVSETTPAVAKQDFAGPSGCGGMLTFTVVQLIEYLHLIGMFSYEAWEKVITYLQNNPEAVCPQVAQICLTLTALFEHFTQKLQLRKTDLSQEKIYLLASEKKTIHDLLLIFNPLLKKKCMKSKLFSQESISIISEMVKSVLYKPTPKRKLCANTVAVNLDYNVKKQKLSKSVSSGESDELESDDFSKLFSIEKNNSNKSNKNSQISQLVQYKCNDKRFRITTPGETGSHLIKIEITNVNDLQNCTSDKKYWEQVLKKGYFLLNIDENEDDKVTLNTLQDILVNVGSKLKNISNYKLDSYDVNKFRKTKD